MTQPKIIKVWGLGEYYPGHQQGVVLRMHTDPNDLQFPGARFYLGYVASRSTKPDMIPVTAEAAKVIAEIIEKETV